MGDERLAEFNRFLEEETAALLSFARRLVGNPDEARDLAQEALAEAYENLSSFEGRSGLKHWVWRILIHRGMRRWRRKRFFDSVRSWLGKRPGAEPAGFGLESGEDPEHLVERRERVGRLMRAMSKLTARQRTVVLLRHAEGMSLEEIARLLETGPGTVKTHLVRAMRRLRADEEAR
jgi:RNA polymerase sigma factor (sigma-70 family)